MYDNYTGVASELFKAIQENSLRKVKTLFEDNNYENVKCDLFGYTPLMAASKLSLFTENTVLINYLIEESNIDETDNGISFKR